MQRISGHEPKMWNVGTIGFDTYHYKYDSGREGDGHVIGYSLHHFNQHVAIFYGLLIE